MSVGVWDPNTRPPEITRELLARFIQLGEKADTQIMDDSFSKVEQTKHAPLMRLPHEQWVAHIKHLDAAQLWQLTRFLTVAEMKFAGWRADEHSPVIAIASTLKAMGQPLVKEQLMWIRTHSDNRFLPHGKIGG